jgi:hypothetical protein
MVSSWEQVRAGNGEFLRQMTTRATMSHVIALVYCYPGSAYLLVVLNATAASI